MLMENELNKEVYEEALRYVDNYQAEIIAKRLGDKNDVKDLIFYENAFDNEKTLKDLDKAVATIFKVLQMSHHIVSFTDSDCDGICSAAITENGIKDYLKHNNITTIVNKKVYGNGMNDTIFKEILELHKKNPISLLLLSDHGSANDAYFKRLKEHIPNIKIVVTDHHEIPETGNLRYVDAFVNPMREDDSFTKRNISGATVIYLVIKALIDKFKAESISLGKDDQGDSLMALAAITVLSDAMSLIEPKNRYILSKGLSYMNNTDELLWKTFKDYTFDDTITEETISFGLAPLINATNRLNYPEIAFRFLTAKTPLEINMHIKRMVSFNNERKEIEAEATLKGIKAAKRYKKDFSKIILQDGDSGVAGLVSQTVGETFYRPTITFTKDKDGDYVGSGRGIVPGLHLKNIFDDIHKKDNTIFKKGKRGGHAGAAGCSVNNDKLLPFATYFDDFVKEVVEEKNISLTPVKRYDIEVNEYSTLKTFSEAFEKLRPFGREFQKPSFLLRTVFIKKCSPIGFPVLHYGLDVMFSKVKIKAFYPKSGFKFKCELDKAISVIVTTKRFKDTIELTILNHE